MSFQVYSRDSKLRSDSLDEASQFSDLDDQLGTSPAHKPHIDKEPEQIITKATEVKTTTTLITDKKETQAQTLEFLKYESEHSSQVLGATIGQKEVEKVIKYFQELFSFKSIYTISSSQANKQILFN